MLTPLGHHSQGLSYLLTFLFAANTIGLTGLAIQLALFPDMDLDAPQLQNKPRAELPKVSVFIVEKPHNESAHMRCLLLQCSCLLHTLSVDQ